MAWPLAGSATRLLVVAGGGWLVVHVLGLPAPGFFAVIALSLALYALLIAAAIWRGRWGA